jgi:hypothetical protein
MPRLILDPAIQSHLGDGKHILEVCDPSGRILGHFFPLLSSCESTKEPQINDEEIQRRLVEGGGRHLADILADLEKLA